MSAERGRRRTLQAVLAAVALCRPTPAPAFDDPLATRPPSLAAAAVLPGDALAAACPLSRREDEVLSLAVAVDLALCRSPQIREAWANIKVQAGALGEARSAFLPRLNGNLSRVDDATSPAGAGAPRSSVRSTTLHAGLEWRIFDFGGRAADQAGAEALLAAALASHQAMMQSALSGVVQAYFDAVAAQAELTAKVESEAMARDTVAAAARREAQGVIGHADTLQAVTALAKSTIEKNRARGASIKALTMLTYAIGEPESGHLLLPESIDDSQRTAEHDLRHWLEAVKQTHPAIVAARAQLDAARHKVDAMRSEGRPTLDLSFNYYRNGRPDQALQAASSRERTLGVMLTVPIFDGFANHYRVAGALAQVEHKEAELDDTQHQVLTDVVKAYADAASSLDNIGASEDLQNAAQEALASSRRRYDHGAADILEILNAQTALADARQERVRCAAEWRAARLRLLASAAQMGRFSVNQ